VNTRYDLADACANTSLVTEIGNILACLANNDTSFLGRDNGTKSQVCLVVFLGCALRSIFSTVDAANAVCDLVDSRVVLSFFGRHVLRRAKD